MSVPRRPARAEAFYPPLEGVGQPLPPPPVDFYIVLEDGSGVVLLEDGSKLVLE